MKHSIWWEGVLQSIEKTFGLELTSTIYLNDIALDTIREIKHTLSEAVDQYVRLNTQQGQRIAYLEMFNTRDMGAWLSLAYAQKPEVENPYISLPEIAAALYKYLLYYDAVAVVEPLTSSIYEADSWAKTLKLDETEATRRFGTRVLQNGLRFWAEMRPALRAGLIETFPASQRNGRIRSEKWNTLRSLDDSYSPERREAERIVLEALPTAERKKVSDFLDSARDSLDTGYINTGILHSAEEQYEFVLQTLFSTVLYVQKGLITARELRDFNLDVKNDLVLTCCQLPSISGLPSDEVLALHRDKDTFSFWRSQLTIILDDVDLGVPGALRNSMKTDVPELARYLTDRLGTLSLKGKLKKAGMSFGAGTIGAFSTTGDPISSLVGGTATSAASLLMDILFERPEKGHGRLQRIYQLIAESNYGTVPPL